jgi:hypothetical protein
MLSKLINTIFTPIEVKAVQCEIRILFNQSFSNSPHLLITSSLGACQRDREDIIFGIRKEKRLPHEVALTIINNIAAGMLATGRYHVFFGVLDSGVGAHLYSIFEVSLEMLVKHRYLTEHEAQGIKKNVDIEIATIG